jgi:hypothetical protein
MVVSMKKPSKRTVVTVSTNIESLQYFSFMLKPPN